MQKRWGTTAIKFVVVFAGTLAWGASLVAHHAFSAEFDPNRHLLLTGTVTKAEWVNPHSWIWLDVKDADGTVVNWGVETGPPNALIRRGWNRSAMPVGSVITVDGYGAKDASHILNAFEVTFPDGTKVFAGSSGTGAPRDR